MGQPHSIMPTAQVSGRLSTNSGHTVFRTSHLRWPLVDPELGMSLIDPVASIAKKSTCGLDRLPVDRGARRTDPGPPGRGPSAAVAAGRVGPGPGAPGPAGSADAGDDVAGVPDAVLAACTRCSVHAGRVRSRAPVAELRRWTYGSRRWTFPRSQCRRLSRRPRTEPPCATAPPLAAASDWPVVIPPHATTLTQCHPAARTQPPGRSFHVQYH